MTNTSHSTSVARLLPALIAISVALPAAAQTAASAPPDSKPGDDQSITLSPFEVSASKDAGYLTQNTLAGTRLNNNIADLPSSITIVTKQQLEDTNSTNINDIFRYEANTEGASSYTPFTLVRSNLSDSLGGGGGTTGNYTSAATSGNRVRGLSSVDIDVDNFFSISRIPFDSYNTDAIEILRGPNSIIFGTGSPAGIVNQERSQADPHATRVKGEVALQVSSYGGFREYLNANIPVIQDRFAVYVGQLYNSLGFAQKPSSDITRRQYAAFTAYPFKNHKTKISGSVERYSNYANDPNGVTPIDFVTPWLNSGQPVWNPQTDEVTFLATGKSGGVYAASASYPNYSASRLQTSITTLSSPYFVPSLNLVANNHNVMFIDQGNLENFFRGSQTGLNIPGWIPALASMNNTQKLVNEQRMSISTGLPHPSNYAAWYDPSVTSRDIYDWSGVNINSLNNTSTKATTYNFSVNQEILSNLNAQVAYFRQDLKQLQDAPLSQANATTMYIDTNQFLQDGRPNPHLGQPFVDVYASDVYSEPEKNENWRAMLDWEPDLREIVPSWLKWLGHHRFVGLFTRHDDIQTNLRYRPAIDGGDANYLPTAATMANAAGFAFPNSSSNAIEQWFYLGGPSTTTVGKATASPGSYNRPNYGGATSPTIETYNYATQSWYTSTVNMDTLLFNTGGLAENLQNSKTFFWQSFFWNDRIVGSFGVNQDTVKNRNTIFPTSNPLATLYTNGFPNPQYWYTYGPWTEVKGTTHTTGVVFHAFKDWAGIDHAADHGNYFAGVLRSISFTFNRASNFNPPSANFTDYFGNALGKSQGKEKDYGIEISSPDNKFFVRATWFKTTNENALVTLTSTARANYIDQTELKNWATKVVEIRNGQNPETDPNFGNTNVYPITPAMQDQIAQLTGLPYTYGGNVGAQGEYVNPAATENGVAKGVEVELTYTPLPNWTMKLTWAKQQTTITGAAAQARAWVNSRSAAWQNYKADDLKAHYITTSGVDMALTDFWTGYGYDTNVRKDSSAGWTSTQQYYETVVGSQLAVDEANNGSLAPNEREYSWSFLTNYTVDRGPLKHLSFGGALRYYGQAVAGYYGDPNNLNSTGQIAAPDISRPIYTPGKFHLDLWLAYSFKMPWVRDSMMKVQFNVSDVTTGGYLLPVTYNFDGTPAAERIIQPRQFSLSAKYEF